MGRRSPADALVLAIVLLAACTSDPSPTPDLTSPSATPSAAATQEPSAPADAGGVYLALGDSITFGIGVPQPQRNGYVAQVADALAAPSADPRIGTTRVFAVPGETASGFLERRLDDVERAIEELGTSVELVTIGLGANEILRARRDEACVTDRAGDACRAVVESATDVAASSLDAVVAGVQSALEAAGSDAAVLLLAYYNPDLDPLAVESVAGSDGDVGCDPLEERPGLNDRIACTAVERSTGLVDLHAAFLGREDQLTRFRAGDVHPNAEGYQVIAEAILDALAAGAGG
ncbi:MAG TPA: SGNH/GDSL hydrolase family protein [Patescibacteria group bacterium]|nr:SGNH/GDSL hydrolase family protein [Patescibacteria group bacterium]